MSATTSSASGFDSRPETWDHIHLVQTFVGRVIRRLDLRARDHDQSKLVEPELSAFDEFTPKLRATTYGSPEYEQHRAALGVALEHHYAANSHHPEHYPDGIHGMCLLDLIEMLADWKAATLRHADGDLDRSITINRERFGYGDEIEGLLRRTAERLGWLTVKTPVDDRSGGDDGS
jgi:Family of unknown function (DUF5662)